MYTTYVDEPLNISLLEIEEHGGVVEVGQVGHVLTAVVLRRVHLHNSTYIIYITSIPILLVNTMIIKG